MRRFSNISLATRLSLVALLVTLMSLAITATVGLARGSSLAEDIVEDRLTALSSSRAGSISALVPSIRREVEGLAASPGAAQAIRDLGDALLDLNAQPAGIAAETELADFYLGEVVPELERVRGSDPGAAFLVPEGDAAVYLQNAYTIPVVNESGTVIAPELVEDAGDGSAYSEIHRTLHPAYSSIALASGYDDLFLVDARRDVVVYSYRKRIEFATSLDLGPHSGSGLSRAVDTADNTPDTGRLTSFSRYVPAIEQPTAFMAASVVEDDEIVGFVVAAISHRTFDEVLRGEPEWESFGSSGDAFLVNADSTMLTTSRLYSSDPGEYRRVLAEPGPNQLTEAQRRRMTTTGTTSTVQQVPDAIVDTALVGPDTITTRDALGNQVRAAVRQLDVDDVNWTLVVQAQTEELDVTIEEYALDMLFAVALFVVAVTFVAVRWSNRLVAPVRAIAMRLRRARAVPDPLVDVAVSASVPAETATGPPDVGDPNGRASDVVPDDASTEFVELADNVEQMLERLGERSEAVAERSRERTSLLEQFLPAAIARRSEEAGSEVLDHVRQASVVAIDIAGLGDLVGELPAQEVRDLLAELVDEIDAIAADLGVERIKFTGSTYYAVCGVSRPLLDHALRSVTFALRVRDEADELSNGQLGIRAGVADGSVSVGLADRAALVYDVWGETAERAAELSHAGAIGTVMVSASVRANLPSDFVVAGEADGGAAAVTSRITEGAES